MDQKSIEAQIKKNLILEGYLKKRSKFLKEWRKRWVVLTSNFLFTFTNKKYQQMTDILEVKEIVGTKSYAKKEDDLTPQSFKIESTENVLHLMAKDTAEKWAWIVTVQRLVDFKYSNYSECKSLEDVKSMGFDSLNTYQEKNPSSKNEKKEDEEEKLEEDEKEEEKSQNYNNLIKMINLFKSQETENKKLSNEVCEIVKEVEEKCTQEECQEIIKKLSNIHQEYVKSQDFQHSEGLIKGLLISKKMQKENEQNKKDIISLVVKDCQKQTTMNWASQLKQLY